jgi:hypothetical protein
MKSNYCKALAVLAAGAGILLSVERVAAAHSEDWDRDGRTLQADVGGCRPSIAPLGLTPLRFCGKKNHIQSFR